MRKRKAVSKSQRAALYLFVVLIASLGALLVSYTNWATASTVRANAQLTTENQSQSKEYAKYVAARGVETQARTQTLADMQKLSLTEAQLVESTLAKATETPASTCATRATNSLTIVVNKKHCIDPSDWTPDGLVSVDGYQMRREVADSLQNMLSAAAAAGESATLTSAYRSYADQTIMYRDKVAAGTTTVVDTTNARPGYSEHQTGLAIDFKSGGCVLECFGTTSMYTWLQSHAADYGFIERYPVGLSSITGYAPEAWHWRYVGKDVALDMKRKHIQTLEQYFGISGGTY